MNPVADLGVGSALVLVAFSEFYEYPKPLVECDGEVSSSLAYR